MISEASHSKWPTARPEAAPEPASPMKCSLPMLAENSDAPIAHQAASRLARK